MIPLKTQSLNKEQRRLLNAFDRLNQGDRDTLLAFAEFLASRVADDGAEDVAVVEQPKAIERPQKESVVAAIRRLSVTYFMLDRKDMLNDTASLMGAHVMQSRPAADVIDELEVLFQTHYNRYLETRRR